MKKASIKYINSRIYYSRSHLKQKQIYSFFSSSKNEQARIINKNDDFIIDESYNNVEFDEHISASFSFDINIDDDKWKKKEEIEYNNFIEKAKKASINPSTFFYTQKMTTDVKNTSDNRNYEKIQMHNKCVDNNISSNIVTSNKLTSHNVECVYKNENTYEDDIKSFLKNSCDDITLQDGDIIKKVIYLNDNNKNLHCSNKEIYKYLNDILDLLEMGSRVKRKDDVIKKGNKNNEQNGENKNNAKYEQNGENKNNTKYEQNGENKNNTKYEKNGENKNNTKYEKNGENKKYEQNKNNAKYEQNGENKNNAQNLQNEEIFTLSEIVERNVGGGHIKYFHNLISKKIYEDPFFLINLNYKNVVTNFTNFPDYYTNRFFKLVVENVKDMTYKNLVFILNILNNLNMKNMMRDLSYEVIKMLNKNTKNDQEDVLQSDNINKKENVQKNDIENNIKLCLHYINILNYHSLYFCEFYDYLILHIYQMKNDMLCFFTLQCFIHSLRTKHYLDKIYFLCLKKIQLFNFQELKCMIYCFHRFCKEYSKFYDLAIDIIKNKYIHNILNDNLNVVQLLLKITNNFKNNDKYVELTGLIAQNIIRHIEENIQYEGRNKKKQKIKKTHTQYINNLTNMNTSIDISTNDDTFKKENLSKMDTTCCNKTYLEGNVNDSNNGFLETSCDNIIKVIECLKYFEYNKKNSEDVKNCVNKIYEIINENIECLQKLCIEDIVYSIVCFSSYNKRIILYNNFLDIICEKSNELINAKNICLWIYPILNLSKISWYHKNYIELLFGYIKDNYILNRLSVFQLMKLLSSVVKMNIYDEDVYKILIEKLYKEWDIIKKKLIDISTFLWCCAYINIIYKPLFDSAYDLIIDLINKNNLNIINNNVIYKNCFVNITWSFIVANYHITQNNFDKILNITFFKRNPNENEAFKRLHQIADSCFKEISKTLINIKCLDILYSYCIHEKCKLLRNNFIIYKKEKDAIKMKNKIHDEIYHLLKHSFHISFDQHIEPYHNSPYLIDICLNQTSKIGICIFGKEYLMRTLKKSSWDFMNTGIVTLQMRILHAHGWKIIPINAGEWIQLNFDQKKNLLSEYFKQYSIQI
ncbi:RAP protein, putative [Plasmodium sp. gorilla clade G2]|uniref:RAP protein, putative n=1 Tax=Plasmodium sp. gorilla clade G2 TaxID=880535 RepID=UPI000D227D8A|nr:RAP protein, putative [Plasmodium sp. gorilla clade G2]SOV11705.1 RAP protein, putative [Plasmodium sp. gorilla clade G2]